MKKLLLAISAISLFANCVMAQTDFGLDSWVNTACAGGPQDPSGWASFNVLTCATMPQTVFKETTPAPYQGSAAAKIVTQQIPAFIPVPGYSTVGLLIVGSISFATNPPTIKYGVDYTGRPSTVTFATKYAPASLDTGWVLVQLTKWNPGMNKADTIASGKFITSAASSTWTLQTIDLTTSYTTPAVSPDTLKIYCSSSSLYAPKVNSALWVDDFSFSGWVSTNDIDGVKNSVTIFPNPATNNVSIKCSVAAKMVEVTDIAGRRIGTYLMNNNNVTIETLGFVPGLYIYNVIDEKNKVLNRGKFEVTK